MRCDILTVFPGLFEPFLNHSLIARARCKKLIEIILHDLRDYSSGRHRQVDDVPYGGGPGMVFKPEPIYKAVEEISSVVGRHVGADREPARAIGGEENGRTGENKSNIRKILLSPRGKPFNQEMAKDLAGEKNILFLCGRYEGIDERVRKLPQIEEISIGDYVLGGGELPAMVIMEAVFRLIPGVIGDEKSAREDSFYHGLLDYPHYTRPADFRGMRVPHVLLSGNHKLIQRWRRRMALKYTRTRRPDLLKTALLTPEDREILKEIESEAIE